MAKTQDIKRRIKSIRNTMQLTRAMKMVAAAKLRRSQDRIMAARPYAHRHYRVLRSLAARANPEIHPLLQQRENPGKVEALVVTADKGLCGAFNAHIIRLAENSLKDFALTGEREVSVATVGKKGREYFGRRGYTSQRQWVDIFRDVRYEHATEIADALMERFVEGDLDEIYLVYNEFKSAIQAKPTMLRLLPIEPEEFSEGQVAEDYIYEPDAQKLFDSLLPHYVRQIVYQALIESAAAEHAARMTAMEAATNNAGELIDSLTLTMNRVRQASITTEIIEVVSGAEALG